MPSDKNYNTGDRLFFKIAVLPIGKASGTLPILNIRSEVGAINFAGLYLLFTLVVVLPAILLTVASFIPSGLDKERIFLV
jgi:hypothetical protein